MYSCHFFLIASAHVRSFIVPVFAWNVTLVSLIFLKRSLVFPILLFFSISLHWSLRKAFFSLLAILWNSAFKWVYLSFSPFLLCFLLLFFSQLFLRPPQTAVLLFCISFSWGWSWSLTSYISLSLGPPAVLTPSHPSRSSQSTNRSSLCYNSRFPLAISVTHAGIFISSLLPIHPIVPFLPVSMCPFSASASLILPCKYVHLHHFSRFHIFVLICNTCFSLVALVVKNAPATWETWIQSRGWEDPLETGIATHSGILA